MILRLLFVSCILLAGSEADDGDDMLSKVDPDKFSLAKDRRYLLYDVNPGEGLNLRRDVHMRVANHVRQLREKGENFVLVLPPFGQSYHWQTEELRDKQIRIPWGLWFDLPSLDRHVPSIEFEQYRKETGQTSKVEIEEVFYLQHYAEGWGDGWAEKYYQKDTDADLWRGFFWGYPYDQIGARRMDCISIMGQASTLVDVVLQPNISHFRSIMVDRAETILHDHFGDIHYWNARRSMRYSVELRDLADVFRRDELNSNDEDDKTPLHEDWTQMKVGSRGAVGGPYLAVHWRRKDFVRAHGKEIPSIQGAADQINALLTKLQLHTVFVGTDGKPHEIDQLRAKLKPEFTLKQYVPPKDVLHEYLDGGVSIIDQWIMAHARYFIGSHVSTFSFRVQDEREILGFDPETSFNRLCPDTNAECEQPAKWKIVS